VGADVREQSFTVPGVAGTFRNVEGVIHPGSEPKEWVICAHYDTASNSPGADDNASGVGVMLEAARVLAQHGPERSVRFVGFTLEEGSPVTGATSTRFLGSGVWAACANGCALRGVINLESVGYTGDSQSYPSGFDLRCFERHKVVDPNRGDFIAILSDKASTWLGKACLSQCSEPVDIPAMLAAIPLNVSEIREVFPDVLRADHVPFWERGIPAITLTDTANFRTPHYHEKTDTVDKLNMDFVGKVCQVTVLTALNACSFNSPC